MKINEHIENYLDYYCNFDHDLGFAVLLRGDWGCGKTWFINNYFNTREKQGINNQFLHISLFGLNSTDQINDRLLIEQHPWLASKTFLITKSVLGNLTKLAFKFDANGDGQPNYEMELNPEKLEQHFLNIKNKILIFDDLERCKIPPEILFGYINNLVEQKRSKVIIIANENKLNFMKNMPNEKTESDDKDIEGDIFSYNKIKEKLIGKTFTVAPDFEEALQSFFNSIKDKKIKTILEFQKDTIKNIFIDAGYANLRHLQQTIHDFEYFYSFLPETAQHKKDLQKHLITLFFIYSFEIKSGNVKAIELKDLLQFSFFDDEDQDSKKEGPLQQIANKYTAYYNYFVDVLYDDFWVQFFEGYKIAKQTVHDKIETSYYYAEERTQEWQKLLDLHYLQDDQFNDLAPMVFRKFENKEYEEIGVLKHLVGVFIELSDRKIIPQTSEDVLQIGKNNIDTLDKTSKLDLKHSDFDNYNKNESYKQHQYWSSKSKEFIIFCDYVDHKIEKHTLSKLPQKREEMMLMLEEKIDDLYEKLLLKDKKDSRYYKLPILKDIDVAHFLASYLKCTPRARNTLTLGIIKRSELLRQYPELVKEKTFLNNFVVQLENRISGEVNTSLTFSNINKYYLPKLKETIARLDSFEAKLQNTSEEAMQ